MKVVHCIYDHPRNPWVGGGGAVRLMEIYRRLARRVDVTLVTGNFPGARGAHEDGFRHEVLGAPGPYAWSRLTYSRAATRFLRDAEYDAGVFDFSAYTPLRLPRSRPVGLMLGQMAGPTARRRWGRLAGVGVRAWERHQLAGARHVSAVSAWLLDEARPLLRPGADARVVGAGVDERFFSVQRAEAGFLLFYGRFDVFQKGLDILLDAVARLATQRPGVRLVMAGRGRDAPLLPGMIAERGLAASTEIVVDPTPERVLQLLGGASALLMPSRFEGFGMVAAEAMAAGVPVLASAVDSLPEVIGADGGILVPGEDAAALARAAAALLDAPELRAKVSASARARAGRYSWDQVAADHLAWLHLIAEERPAFRRPFPAP